MMHALLAKGHGTTGESQVLEISVGITTSLKYLVLRGRMLKRIQGRKRSSPHHDEPQFMYPPMSNGELLKCFEEEDSKMRFVI